MSASPLSTELALVQSNLDATKASLTGIATGVVALDALIQKLQGTPGVLDATDQAALDAIAAASTALVAQAAAVNTTAPGTVAAPASATKPTQVA